MNLSLPDIPNPSDLTGTPVPASLRAFDNPTAIPLADSFAARLSQQASRNPAARQAQAEKAAGDLVSNALILPMLKQLRRSSWAEQGLFSPNTGEKTFGPQFDMQIADRIAQSPRLGIKKSLAQSLLKRGQKNNKPLDVHG